MQTEIGIIKQSLFSLKKPNPYYLYCPPIKIHSAGVSVMHRLCHLLNRMGYPAYVVIERNYLGRLGYPPYPTFTGLVTPELSQEIARQHYDEGLTPVVIYPDSVKGDPLGAPYICRYMLNYPGFFGGETSFGPGESVVSYSRKIALKTQSPDHVLFFPISDPDFFVPPEGHSKRTGAYRYSEKFVHIHGGKIDSSLEHLPEITRDRRDSPTKEGLRDIFQTSEYFYAFENTALSIEAALSGCPVILMPNKWFTEIIAENELGMDGFAWGVERSEVERAKETVHLFRDRYMSCINNVQPSVERLIAETQGRARATKYSAIVDLSSLPIHVGIEIGKLIGPSQLFAKIGLMRRRYSRPKLLLLIARRGTILFLRATKLEKPVKWSRNKATGLYHRTRDRVGKARRRWMIQLGLRPYESDLTRLPVGNIPPHVL